MTTADALRILLVEDDEDDFFLTRSMAVTGDRGRLLQILRMLISNTAQLAEVAMAEASARSTA